MTQRLPYQNPDLPIEARLDDILGRMSWQEKVDQLGSRLPFTDWNEWFRHPIAERIRLTLELPYEEMVKTGSFSVVLRELPARLAAETANRIYSLARKDASASLP